MPDQNQNQPDPLDDTGVVNTTNPPASPQPFPDQEAPATGQRITAVGQQQTEKEPTDQQLENTQNSSPPESITTSSKSGSSSNLRSIIAGILGLLIVVGGVAGGVFLVQREQNIKSKAATQECFESIDCVIIEDPGNSGSYNVDRAILDVYLTDDQVRAFDPTVTQDGCYRVVAEGDNLVWEKIGPDSTCEDLLNIQVWMAPESSGEDVTAQCTDIKFYNTEGELLSQDELAQLTGGDSVRIAVGGSYDTGTIDSARFIINGTTTSQVTSKDATAGEFYYDYQIPEQAVELRVQAQLHHTTAGWF